MVFRVADKFLPVTGKDIWTWFQRLKPFLDGRTNIEQLYECLERRKRGVLDKLLGALRQEAMLYDADQEDYNIMPESVSKHCAGFIARAEAHSSQPFRAFAAARQSHLMVVGHFDKALAVIDAGLEAGLSQQTICALDWTS